MENIAVLMFFGACLFIPMLCDALYGLSNRNLIPDEVEVIKYVYIEKPQPPQPVIKKEKPKVVEKINPIKDDAIQCLISLGMKKSEAIKKPNELFEKFDYESIESFLLDVYKV